LVYIISPSANSTKEKNLKYFTKAMITYKRQTTIGQKLKQTACTVL